MLTRLFQALEVLACGTTQQEYLQQATIQELHAKVTAADNLAKYYKETIQVLEEADDEEESRLATYLERKVGESFYDAVLRVARERYALRDQIFKGTEQILKALPKEGRTSLSMAQVKKMVRSLERATNQMLESAGLQVGK